MSCGQARSSSWTPTAPATTAKFTFNGVPKPDVVPDAPAPEMATEPVISKGSTVGGSTSSPSPQDGGGGTASAVG